MDLTCLPASLHNRPEQIPSRIAARIRRARGDGYDRIFVAYADTIGDMAVGGLGGVAAGIVIAAVPVGARATVSAGDR